MAYWTRGPNSHNGAKNGAGYHGPRADAKKASKKGRRAADKRATRHGRGEGE